MGGHPHAAPGLDRPPGRPRRRRRVPLALRRRDPAALEQRVLLRGVSGTVSGSTGPTPPTRTPETPVHGRGDGTLVPVGPVATRSPMRSRTSTSRHAARTRPADRARSLSGDGPLVVLTRVKGVYPDSWVGRRVSYRRLSLHRGPFTVRLGTDEHLFTRPQLVTAREAGRVVADVLIVPGREPTLKIRLRPDATQTCDVDFTTAITRVPSRVQPGSTDTRRLGAHYFAFDYATMRIAFDVSPLSHERTGVNNYIRGALAGLAAVARPRGHEIVAFAPTWPPGATPFAALSRVSTSRPSSCGSRRHTSFARPGRDSAVRQPSGSSGASTSFTHGLDVPPAGTRRARHDGARSRAGAPPAMDDAADARDAHAQVPQRGGDVRPDLRELRVHRR